MDSAEIKSRLKNQSAANLEELFQQSVSDLMTEIVEMLHKASTLEADARLDAYETIISKTASVLQWINSQTKLRQTIDKEHVLSLERQKLELESKWEKLLSKAAALKKENDQLRKKHSGGNSSSVELAALMLGVAPKSSISEIKTAYRKQAKKVHPDTSNGDEQMFKALTEAMLVLVKQAPIN